MPAGSLRLIHRASAMPTRRPRIRRFRSVAVARGNNYNRRASGRIRGAPRGFITSQPFPPRKYCTMVYAESLQLGTGVGQNFGGQNVYSLNGLFDPNIAGGGHQPLGFDQVMAIYSEYKVIGCKVELTCTGASVDDLWVGTKIRTPGDAQNLAGLSLEFATEIPNIRLKAINDSGTNIRKFNMYLPSWRTLMISRIQFGSDVDQFTGDVGNNPAVQSSFVVAIINPNEAVNRTIGMTIKLTYNCMFYNKKTLPQS